MQELIEMVRKEAKEADEAKSKLAKRFLALTETAIKFKAANNEKYKVFA